MQALSERVHLEHLSPTIGTEVHGIDLAATFTGQDFAWFGNLLVERKVLFFREQNISIEEHIEFARGFGDIEVHPFTNNDSAYPQVIRLANDRERPPQINVWHSDVTWRECPSLGSILRARVVPPVGGDTLFADMEAAYDRLSDETKETLGGLMAVHDNEVFLRGMQRGGASDEAIEAKRAEFPPARHPVVRTHPVSGRKSIYVNKVFTRTIEGMADAEAQALLQSLYLKAWIPDYQCRFRWRVDSLAFWDNRAVQHYAAADYWPERRVMERVTVIGDRPR
ncbi:MAG: taurine dioxygenase [Gammaproteobacteria bacterium]|nr:taurine dioxygenase [Gammaproteobacteria bacterium]